MRVLTIIALLLLSSVSGASQLRKVQKQPKPDLTGVWLLDESRSDINRGRKEKLTDYVLTVVHAEPEIRMTIRFKQGDREQLLKVIYYTNGKPELSLTGIRDPEPVTRWRGNKLVRRTVSRAMTMQTVPPLEIVTTDEWEISPDGKTLIRTSISTGLILQSRRYVFNRSS